MRPFIFTEIPKDSLPYRVAEACHRLQKTIDEKLDPPEIWAAQLMALMGDSTRAGVIARAKGAIDYHLRNYGHKLKTSKNFRYSASLERISREIQKMPEYSHAAKP